MKNVILGKICIWVIVVNSDNIFLAGICHTSLNLAKLVGHLQQDDFLKNILSLFAKIPDCWKTTVSSQSNS